MHIFYDCIPTLLWFYKKGIDILNELSHIELKNMVWACAATSTKNLEIKMV